MRLFLLLSVLLWADLACVHYDSGKNGMDAGTMKSDGGQIDASSEPPAKVYETSTFEITQTLDVVYAQGLKRSSWTSDDADAMDLTLDTYVPDNEETQRPAVVLVHGGGFAGGSTTQNQMVGFCEYFAERGFVAFSVDYRVLYDYGLTPEWWADGFEVIEGLGVDQAKATYAAGRDVKAAIRWIRANAETYGIHPDYIGAIGGSAGSFITVMLGVANEEDFKEELTIEEDPTLESTHLDQSSAINAMVDHWGGHALLDLLTLHDGVERFDSTDAPVQIVHGDQDDVVPFDYAINIRNHYRNTDVSYRFIPLAGAGHGPWGAQFDGQTLTELSYDFLVNQLNLRYAE